MIKTLKFILSALVLGIALSSCGDASNEATTTRTFTGCFAIVRDSDNPTGRGYDKLTYEVKLNYTTSMAQINIKDLQLDENTTYNNVSIADIPFKITKEGWVEVTSNNTVGVVAGSERELALTGLDLRMCDRYIADSYYRVFYMNYTIDGQYTVLSSPVAQYQFGTTMSTSPEGVYETTATDYVFGIDPKNMTFNLLIKNTAFVEQMPSMNILLEKVPFTVSGSTLSFKADEIVPKIGDTPYPGYTITDLNGYLDLSTGMTMRFSCTPEKMPLDFNVSVDCKYTFSK